MRQGSPRLGGASNGCGVPGAGRGAQGRDQLLGELPGVSDVERAKGIIGAPGLLGLKIVEGAPSPSKEALMVNGQIPQGMDIVPGAGSSGDTSTVYYLVKKVSAVTGQDLRNARASVAENNRPAVSLTLSNHSGRPFGKGSAQDIARQPERSLRAPTSAGKSRTISECTRRINAEAPANPVRAVHVGLTERITIKLLDQRILAQVGDTESFVRNSLELLRQRCT